jgi:probable F420-dependent oxidoreductase
MQLGVRFPHKDFPAGEPDAIRSYIKAVEERGLRHVWSDDHILGVDPSAHPGWEDAYSHENSFHEQFVLLGFLAAIAPLELVTAITQLPMRPTAMVAKQAAEVDLLTGGKLRVGVAVGHNQVEYEALGQDFGSRGKRLDAQIDLLRELWTKPVVDFDGKFDRVASAGLNPMPIQQPIPIWIGGLSGVAVRRAIRTGDGFLMGEPIGGRGDRHDAYTAGATHTKGSWTESVNFLRAGLREAGRDARHLGSTPGSTSRAAIRRSGAGKRTSCAVWR